jgi:NADH dehydrogenase
MAAIGRADRHHRAFMLGGGTAAEQHYTWSECDQTPG